MRHALLLLAAAVAFAAPLSGQVRLDGVVRDDSTGASIPQARVEVVGPYYQRIGSRAADSLGTFRFALRRFGEYRVKVSAPGYADVDAAFRTEAFVYSSVEVRLRRQGQLSTALAFLARTQLMPSPALEGYYARQRRGRGAFFNRMHVELVRPGYITDLIATAPGVEQQRAGLDGEHRTLLTRGTGCPLRVYVDGVALVLTPSTGEAGPSVLDGSVDQSMVEGIEVYVDPAALPPELGGGTERCGAVAIWTKRQG